MTFQIDRALFRALYKLKLDFLFCSLSLKYLENWGTEQTTLKHKLALAYLMNLEIKKRNFFDRFAVTYVYVFRKGHETTSLFDRLVNFYIVKRELKTHSFFALISKAFLHLWERRENPKSLFDEMAVRYIVARCNEAVSKGVAVCGLGEVFDLAKIQGAHLVNLNLERISKTPMAFETAKIAIACRSSSAFRSGTEDTFEHNMEMGYWTGALERLVQIEDGENVEENVEETDEETDWETDWETYWESDEDTDEEN